MENPISSSGTVWCFVALLFLLALSIAASVQARLNVRAQVSNRCGDPWRSEFLAHRYEPHCTCCIGVAYRPHDIGSEAAVSGKYRDWFMRAHCAPAHGKEYAPC